MTFIFRLPRKRALQVVFFWHDTYTFVIFGVMVGKL